MINGGTVNATAGQFGAAIGDGARGSADITINGGNINADGAIGYGAGGNSPDAVILCLLS